MGYYQYTKDTMQAPRGHPTHAKWRIRHLNFRPTWGAMYCVEHQVSEDTEKEIFSTPRYIRISAETIEVTNKATWKAYFVESTGHALQQALHQSNVHPSSFQHQSHHFVSLEGSVTASPKSCSEFTFIWRWTIPILMEMDSSRLTVTQP